MNDLAIPSQGIHANKDALTLRSIKDRQLSWLHIHQSVPLAITYLLIIIMCKFLYFLISLLTAMQEFTSMSCCRQYRVLDGSEVSIFQPWANQGLNIFHTRSNNGITLQVSLSLIAESGS